MEHVRSHEQWEIAREFNPLHKMFWIDLAFFCGLAGFATWQVWEYAHCKARGCGKGYLFSGAHHLWRMALTCALVLILVGAEWIHPGHKVMHYITGMAMLLDAGLLFVHTERVAMPLLFPTIETGLTVLLAFGVSDKGRMTAPIILLIAGFRYAGELWPMKKDEDAFKIVAAVLMASLGWHWFPLSEAINLWSVDQMEVHHHVEYNATIDLVFMCDTILGHITVLVILWKILPEFFRNELAFELRDDSIPKDRTSEMSTY